MTKLWNRIVGCSAGFMLLLAALGAAHAAEPYRVNAGDLLQVTVYGEERLSGRFRVDPEGAINYPLLGSVVVGNLTTNEISRRLRAPASGPPTVEVVEYAQVFVVGDVEKPGPYQFRPGMIVLELVALGGGVRRPTEAESRLLSVITAEQELAELRIARFAQTLQRLRVSAEIKGEAFQPSSAPNEELITAAERQRIIANETTLFNVRASTLAGQQAAIKAQRASYDVEIASLTESIGLHDEEVKLLLQEVSTQEELFKKGLSVQTRLLTLKRELSATKRNALDFRLALARARQRQLELDQKLSDTRDARLQENATALRDIDLELARTTERLASATTRLSEIRAKKDDTTPRALRYTVTRFDNGRYVTSTVNEIAALQPRDILRIERVTGDSRDVVAKSDATQ